MARSNRLGSDRGNFSAAPLRAAGFTLLEVMIALTVTLILMGLVMEMFANVSDGINNSRANMDLNDQLRHAKHRLIADLRGITAPTIPPLSPHMNVGYFEYVEGPRVANSQYAAGSSGGDVGENLGGNWYTSRGAATNQIVNSIIGDVDDILMFTTSSFEDRFVGRGGIKNGVTLGVNSRYAEVAWFLRRRTQAEQNSIRGDARPEFYTLHRRQWLVSPNATVWVGDQANPTYAEVDLSLRPEGGNFESTLMPLNLLTNRRALDPRTAKNSLGDLTMRERRSLHQPYLWPYQMLYVAPQFANNVNGHYLFNPGSTYTIGWNVPTSALSLPTLGEQTHGNFPLPNPEKRSATGVYVLKSTFTPTPPVGYAIMQTLGNGSRIGDDILLSNVVGFDVKAWDPGAPVFRAAATTANPNNASVLVPGDGGYPRAVDVFNAGPTAVANQPVAFGAFADLNYMGQERAFTGTTNNRTRYTNYMDNGTSSALVRMENGAPFNRRCLLPRAQFAYPGDGPLSGNPTNGDFARPAVWDTWSTHYEYDGVDNDGDGVIDELTNGVDDNGNGLVDEPNHYFAGAVTTGEQEAPPPYRSPLRGLKITLRVMEQDSKEVREVTVVHEFVPL